jgi:ubiquinone/menaquinone biosynthesis C-methylase UbiE
MRLRRVDYDERLCRVYAAGRRVSPEVLAAWMGTFAGFVPGRRPLTVVDVGCGVGRLSPALAEAFGGPVVALDPSVRMLRVARGAAAHPRVC